MSARIPSRDWLLGSLGSIEVSSSGLTGPMNNYPDLIHQLVVELGVLSRTSRGRTLLSRIQTAGLDTRGCATALEFAQDLEWNPRTEPSPEMALDQLVVLSSGDREVALVLLVALRRAIREMIFSIGRQSSDLDIGSIVLVELLSVIAISDGDKSVGQLLDRTYRATQRLVRRRDREVLREVPWEVGLDAEEIVTLPELFTCELLEEVFREGLIGQSDIELIRQTRIDGEELADAAARLNEAYKTVQRRRHRAESIILQYLLAAEES